MPSLAKRLSRSGESKEKVDLERASVSTETAPPPYSEQAINEEGDAGPTDLTAGFSNLKLGSSTTITPDPRECIAHLKLLQSFYCLKQAICARDGLFGISESDVESSFEKPASEDDLNQARAMYSEKRWQVYVSRAVLRFERWRKALEADYEYYHLRDITTTILAEKVQGTSTSKEALVHAENLPPLDVLMVWHSYMLNPRAYLEDCLREGRMSLWHTPMPWEAIIACIDDHSFRYQPVESVQQAFEAATHVRWDNLVNPEIVSVRCARCSTKALVPWTTCDKLSIQGPQTPRAVSEAFSTGTGFADKSFVMVCETCEQFNDHDALCVAKFSYHVRQLLDNDVMMQGTFLSRQGLPTRVKATTDEAYQWTFPCRLLKAGLGKEIIRSCKAIDKLQMSRLRDFIEEGLKDRDLMCKARSSPSARMLRYERVAIRRMMSRYRDNSSNFALDLVGAVIRQGEFVEKMHDIDWLHSPALPSTMKRLVVKYLRFVDIMRTGDNMAVPTLDVDLAWHTHQLNPPAYFKYTTDVTGQFIDHDDKVAETKLNSAFAWTSKRYQKLYNEPYSECTCWYCEAVRESHTSTTSRLFRTSTAAITDSVHKVEKDPRKSIHISAHNAIKPTDESGTYDVMAKRQAYELERHYQKACARAEKKGRPAPRRDDYYYSTAWGYPVYIGAYMPFYGMPYGGGIYASNPSCAAAAGAGCVAGSCSSSVGSCGAGAACGGGQPAIST